jgi:hypothetical protein
MKPGRNDPCPCGSGKKYKKCCGAAIPIAAIAPAPTTHAAGNAASGHLLRRMGRGNMWGTK